MLLGKLLTTQWFNFIFNSSNSFFLQKVQNLTSTVNHQLLLKHCCFETMQRIGKRSLITIIIKRN